jgi:hypothetical protein
MKKAFIISFLLIGLFILPACESEKGSFAQSSENSKVQEISNQGKQAKILATATHASVDSSGGKNWDADLEDDGVIIYPELKDADNETVKFEGVELTVDIEIWTTKMDDNWKEVKDRLIYSGSGTIDSWKDGNFMFGGGIKISFEDIKAVESDKDYGELFIKIHTPDGKVFEAKDSMGIRIKPE